MISIENKVFDALYEVLKASFSSADITSEYVQEPASFPHVSVVEADNYTSLGNLDSGKPRFDTVMYEINVYSNKKTGKKSECKKIMSIIDEKMLNLNFVRTAMTPVPNMLDATVYRIVARYRAETDGSTIYRKL